MPTPSPTDRSSDPVLRKSRGFSLVWLIPLVAAGIGLWLAWSALVGRGPLIAVTFNTAEGLEAGRTPVKYREVTVGVVESVRALPDLSGVELTARIEHDFADHLTEGTRFWVVRPRFGSTGVSGIGTILSGAYLEIDPGSGESARQFVGLEEPPLIRTGAAGREFLLVAENLGSVNRGAPVYYRGLPVGQVLGYRLAEDARRFEVPVFVQSPYDRLVVEDSSFWDVSGIRVRAGVDGLEVQVAGLAALVAGGVEFSSPLGYAGERAADDTHFILYPDLASVGDLAFEERIPFVIEFDGSVRGLRVGAPVEIRGIRVGSVERVDFVPELARGRAPIRVFINVEPQRVAATLGVKPNEASDDDGFEQQYATAAEAVGQGLRAQLRTGNILTGELFVDIDFFPDAPPATLETVDGVPRIPAVPTELEALTATVSGVLDRLAALPLEGLGQQVERIATRIEALVSSPAVTAGVADLATAGADLRALIEALSDRVPPLVATTEGTLRSLRSTIEATEQTMREVSALLGEGSTTRYQVDQVLQELSRAARSIRGFAETLERDPGAIIRGRREF